MKILGGRLRGRNFYMPKDIRPTPNLIREAIFDIIGHDLSYQDFLELFAGSGAVGLEAISRNAEKVIFVERESRCREVIEENLQLLKISSPFDPNPKVHVFQTDTFVAIKKFAQHGEKFHIVFLDPPYHHDLAKKALKTLGTHDILQPNAFVIIEHDQHEILPEQEGRILLIRQKKYGNSILSIYENR